MATKRSHGRKSELPFEGQGALRVVTDQSDYSLPSWIYSNAEFFELERKHIFDLAWHLICHVSDIPDAGDYRTLKILGETVFAVRGKDGEIRAFYNVCRHRAARLLDGEAGRCPGRITCPYHHWSYGLDGKLVGVPEREEYERIDLSTHNLVPLQLEIFMGFVCVRFESGRSSIADFMAPVKDELELYKIEELQPLGRISHHVRHVNWKNGVDNYIDALHVRAAHPGLNSLIGKTYTLEDREIVFRLWGEADHEGRGGMSARTYSKIVPRVDYLPESHQKLWLYFMVWPNLAFNLYPDLVEFMQFLPVSGTKTIIRYGAYGLPDANREMRLARYLNHRINREVNIEDKDLIDRVQEGMGSRSYRRGPLGKHEVCLRGFAKRMREILPVSQLDEAPAAGTVNDRNEELRAR